MSNPLSCNYLTNKKEQPPIFSSFDYLFFNDLLKLEEENFRKEVRNFAEKEITPIISDYYEKAEFPQPLFEKIGQKGWLESFYHSTENGGRGITSLGLFLMEIARVDASMATVLFVHIGVIISTIKPYGSEEQKKRYIPDLCKMKTYSGWGLTEEAIGSDASNLQTTATKTTHGYEINGNKRWPGNANRDIIIIWARNTDTKIIEGYIVPISLPGVKVEVIKHKGALRCVQNCSIKLDKVVIPEENKLPGTKKGFLLISAELAQSRAIVAWIATGIAIGVYDNTIKYVNNREQFGVKLTSFQLTQEKLSRMMGHIQSMLLIAWRITKLCEQKKMTAGMSSMAKAWTTSLCREVAKLGRELLGGNGIICDNYVMKALLDIEGVYTYEGTYEINSLVMGRELTGISAFKPKL